MSRLSWRNTPDETGLARITQSPRGFELRYGQKRIATVQYSKEGWFYYASSAEHCVPSINTASDKRFSTKEAAKADCDAYVRKHFKKGSTAAEGAEE